MSIAFDSSSAGNNSGISNTITVSHTVTGSNMVLFVGLLTNVSFAVSSATYNSVSLGTPLWDVSIGGVNHRSYGYLLVNPSTGTHDISITVTGGNDPFGVLAMSFSGVDQGVTPYRTIPTPGQIQDFATNPATVTVAASQASDMVIDFMTGYQGTLTANGSQTMPTPGKNEGVGAFHMGTSYKSAAGANTVMSWTQGGPTVGVWIEGALALIPVASGSSAPMFRGS